MMISKLVEKRILKRVKKLSFKSRQWDEQYDESLYLFSNFWARHASLRDYLA